MYNGHGVEEGYMRNGLSIACAVLSLVRSAQIERDNESYFFVQALIDLIDVITSKKYTNKSKGTLIYHKAKYLLLLTTFCLPYCCSTVDA